MDNTFLALLALSSLFALASAQLNATCQRQAKKSDNCLRHATLVGREERVLPRSVAEVDSLMCSSLSDDIRCINDLKSCLKPFPRTLYQVAMRSVRNGIKSQFCGSTKGKKSVVRAFKCLRTDGEISRLFNILDQASATIDAVAEKSPVDLLLPHICCVYQTLYVEGKATMDQLCKGNPKLSNVILKLIASFFEDVVDLGCGLYKSLDYCDVNQAEAMQLIRGTWNNQTERYKSSPIIPILTLLDRLDASMTAN